MNDHTTDGAWNAFVERELAKGYNGNGHSTPLALAARQWPTTNVRDSARHTTDPSKPMHPGTTLTDAVRGLWTTPKTPTGGAESRESRGSRGSGGADLEAQAQTAFPTPGANDWKGSHREGQRRGQLDEAVENGPAHGPPAPESETSGPGSSPTTPTSRPRLSPTFVEWLMCFPRGYTDPATWSDPSESIDSAHSGTQSSQSRPATHSLDSGGV